MGSFLVPCHSRVWLLPAGPFCVQESKIGHVHSYRTLGILARTNPAGPRWTNPSTFKGQPHDALQPRTICVLFSRFNPTSCFRFVFRPQQFQRGGWTLGPGAHDPLTYELNTTPPMDQNLKPCQADQSNPHHHALSPVFRPNVLVPLSRTGARWTPGGSRPSGATERHG